MQKQSVDAGMAIGVDSSGRLGVGSRLQDSPGGAFAFASRLVLIESNLTYVTPRDPASAFACSSS